VTAFLASHAGFSAKAVRIDHMLLFESRLGSEGAHYDAVARYPLT